MRETGKQGYHGKITTQLIGSVKLTVFGLSTRAAPPAVFPKSLFVFLIGGC